ncbi:MAG: putative toxin-antitoxin system toxin component, PIN family [Thermomicrobiales bacterium]|nr:putative toxin-antitoxin system toxin component, PIN family [Thermomicrobiales bacterium]
MSSSGSPAQLFERLRQGAFDLLVSPEIVAEYGAVLNRDPLKRLHRMSVGDIRDAVSYLLRRSLIVIPPDSIQAILNDPKDDMFIECAVAGGADVIISGDRHLLAMGVYGEIRIVTPAEFLEILDVSEP